jgi:2-methylcitrate dehydratase PrpD
MARIEVVSDPEFSRDWVSNPRHRIEISLDDGARRSVDVGPARGHPRNPVTDEEIRTKFLDNSVTAVEAHAADALLESLWHIEDMDSVREMTPALRSARAVGVR